MIKNTIFIDFVTLRGRDILLNKIKEYNDLDEFEQTALFNGIVTDKVKMKPWQILFAIANELLQMENKEKVPGFQANCHLDERTSNAELSDAPVLLLNSNNEEVANLTVLFEGIQSKKFEELMKNYMNRFTRSNPNAHLTLNRATTSQDSVANTTQTSKRSARPDMPHQSPPAKRAQITLSTQPTVSSSTSGSPDTNPGQDISPSANTIVQPAVVNGLRYFVETEQVLKGMDRIITPLDLRGFSEQPNETQQMIQQGLDDFTKHLATLNQAVNRHKGFEFFRQPILSAIGSIEKQLSINPFTDYNLTEIKNIFNVILRKFNEWYVVMEVIFRLQNKLVALKDTMTEMQNHHKQVIEHNTQLTQDIKGQIQEKLAAQQQLQLEFAKRSQAQTAVKTLEASISQLTKELNTEKERNKILTDSKSEEICKLKETIEELKIVLDLSKKDVSQLTQRAQSERHTHIQSQLEQADEILKLKSTVTNLQTLVTQLKTDLSSGEKQKNEAPTHLEQSTDRETQKKQADKILKLKDKLKTTTARLTTELNTLKEENKALTEQKANDEAAIIAKYKLKVSRVRREEAEKTARLFKEMANDRQLTGQSNGVTNQSTKDLGVQPSIEQQPVSTTTTAHPQRRRFNIL